MNTMKAAAVIFGLLALVLTILCLNNPAHPAAVVAVTFAFASAMLSVLYAGLSDAPWA